MRTLARLIAIVGATVSLMMLVEGPSAVGKSTNGNGATIRAFLSERSLRTLEIAAREINSTLTRPLDFHFLKW